MLGRAVLPDSVTLIRPTTRGAPGIVDGLRHLLRRNAAFAARLSRHDCKDNIGYTSSPITWLNFCKSASGNASSGLPRRMASTTASPTIWCASRNGTPFATGNPPAPWRWHTPVAPRPDNVGVSPEYRPAPTPPYAGSQAGIERIEQPFFVFLHIFVIRQRQTFKVIIMPVSALVRDRTYRESAPARPGFSSAALTMNRKSRGQKALQNPLHQN